MAPQPDLRTPDGSPVHPFAFGTMQWGGKADAAESRAMYDACRAAGINHFDTAHGYTGGESERLLGQFAAAERERLFIASKCASTGDCRPESITRDVEQSLSRLGVDGLDLLYLHRWNGDTPLEPTYEALARMREKGWFRHLGVSNYAAWQVMKAQCVAAGIGLRIEVLQPMYNLVKRQAEVEILPMAGFEGMAVFPYSPLGGGLLTGKYAGGGAADGRLAQDPMYSARYAPEWMHKAAEGLARIAARLGLSPITLAVAWVARNPAVTGPIISASRAAQLAPSLAAIDLVLDDATYAELSALTPAPPPATDRLEEA